MAFNPKQERIASKKNTKHDDFSEIAIPFTYEEAKLESSRCLNCKTPSCVNGCPLHLPIPTMIKLINEGKDNEAAKLINDVSPLSLICAIVCDHKKQCEGNCIRNKNGQPVSIGKLHRYAASTFTENNFSYVKRNGKKVAIIGAGPSGLSCANKLDELGYEVSIFEKEKQIGGVPYYGIPTFRLSSNDLSKSINKIFSPSFHLYLNKKVSVSEIIDDYDAIYLACGTPIGKTIGIKGEDLPNVITSEELLKDIKVGLNYRKYLNFKNVYVVGGGNVALDAARSIKRIVDNVTIVYRRSIDEAPCRKDELKDAEDEGINLSFLTNPKEVLGDENGIKTIVLTKMKLGEPDESGRRRPIEVENSLYSKPIDLLITAISSTSEAKVIEGLENERGLVLVNDKFQTSNPRVFAGGDIVTGPLTVVQAIKSGIEASKHIDDYLSNI